MAAPEKMRIAANLVMRCEKEKADVQIWLGRLEHAVYSGADTTPAAELLDQHLMSLATLLAIGLEQLGLPESRRDLMEYFEPYASGRSDTWTVHHDVELYVYSPVLQRLEDYLEGARMLAQSEDETRARGELERLEELLQDTAWLVHNRNPSPGSEHDVQEVMHHYLSVVFPDFVKTPTIPGSLKHFKADGGVRTLRAAIEFKYADSEEELKTALSGVYEDMCGYSGSLDWQRFFSVFYLTRPLASRASILAEVRRPVLAETWTPITVVGGGKRRRAMPRSVLNFRRRRLRC